MDLAERNYEPATGHIDKLVQDIFECINFDEGYFEGEAARALIEDYINRREVGKI